MDLGLKDKVAVVLASAFLASDGASCVNGVTLQVDGGAYRGRI